MTTESPSIDFSFLDQMLKIARGNPRFVVDSIRRFLDTGLKDILEIKSFSESHDRIFLKTKTHRMISTCSVVGAMRMIDISSDLSTQAETQEIPILEKWIEDLHDEFAVVKKALNEYLEKIMAPN